MRITLRNGASVLLFFALAASAAMAGENKSPKHVSVHIRDSCDPTTFNQVFGDGVCDGNHTGGFLTVPQFLTELTEERSVGEWRFNPVEVETERPVQFTLTNRGGETHTFTRVKKFGGGFVAPLNGPSGVPDPAPECAQMVNGQLVPQAPSANNIFVAPGQTVVGPRVGADKSAKFQCCIHPWMRLEVNDDEKEEHEHHEHHEH